MNGTDWQEGKKGARDNALKVICPVNAYAKTIIIIANGVKTVPVEVEIMKMDCHPSFYRLWIVCSVRHLRGRFG